MGARIPIEKLIENIEAAELEAFFANNGIIATYKHFNLKCPNHLKKVLDHFHIDYSSRDAKKINSINTSKTLFNKYGVKHALQIPEAKKKAEQTNIARFGSPSYLGTAECREKTLITNNEKYGADWSNSTQQGKEKRRQANIAKYGMPDAKQRFASEALKSYLNNKSASIKLIGDNEKTLYDICTLFSADAFTQIYSWLVRFDLINKLKVSNVSKEEQELIAFIDMKDLQQHDRDIIKPNELDIVIPSLRFAIEYNGDYWHCSDLVGKYYHKHKSQRCSENGYSLMHIFEYEWRDPIKREILKSILDIKFNRVKNKIYARKCEVREISNGEAKPFNNKNHLQGHRNAKITYGLFYNDILVQLMSFSKHNKYEWEIIRGCPGSNNLVVGGVSKLFKYFITKHNPDMIFSYCDWNKFDGHGYELLGMKEIGKTGPDKRWVIRGKVVNRNASRYAEYKETAQTIIWGAGSKKYLWKKEKNNEINN